MLIIQALMIYCINLAHKNYLTKAYFCNFLRQIIRVKLNSKLAPSWQSYNRTAFDCKFGPAEKYI